MKVALIGRATLFTVPGGDTVQMKETAKQLVKLGVVADVLLTNQEISYEAYDLFHYFNLIRPADILYHIHRTTRPFVVSPILVDFSEYDKFYRKGLAGRFLRRFSPSTIEYIKTVSRWALGKDELRSKDYLWKGQQKSIKEILRKTKMVLPNSLSEFNRLQELYKIERPYAVIPNGIDPRIFYTTEPIVKNDNLVLCAARIEGRKNQFNLIRALNNTEFQLLLIGDPAPNQKNYYRLCKQIAAPNVEFIPALPQEELVPYYRKAKVHVLPSWFETCGLSSLEAAAMGCNIVITDRGDAKEYFSNEAFYCDPETPHSIYCAIVSASKRKISDAMQKRIRNQYTWNIAGETTLEAYKEVLSHFHSQLDART